MKKLALLLCLFFVFVSCGKDEKTIEKIIYGDKTSSVLDKDDYNKVSTTKSFNNIDDFVAYMTQCYNDKVNLVGKKFKVKGTFEIIDSGFCTINEKHYYMFRAHLQTSENPQIYMDIKLLDTDKNLAPPSQLETDLIYIVTKSNYKYSQAGIEGYSYNL